MLSSLIAELSQGDDVRALDAVHQLAAYGEQAIPPLAGLATHSDPDVRWWAIHALSELHCASVSPLLQAALRDPSMSVRACAAAGLRLNPDPAAIPDLIATLKVPNMLLARLTANALVAIGKPAVPALIALLENAPQLARVEAVRALAEIRDPRSIETFFRLLQDGDSPIVEHWAEEGLQRLGVGMTYFPP